MASSDPIVVIGGGPVGAMQAIFLARRGFKVELYESKKDIRVAKQERGRSINLSVSFRGQEALKAIGCDEPVMHMAVPMNSRYIHHLSGKISIHLYNSNGKYVNNAVDRQKLNEFLLSKAEEMPNIKLHFEHKLLRSDLNTSVHTFSSPDRNEVDVKYSFTFGCDGAYSTVRRQLMRWGRLDYSQTYIEHGYKELTMPANDNGDYAMLCNHLHIWPRQEFMMIAMPNLDQSFTLTLFMPFVNFEAIKTKHDLLNFFQKHFPDSIDKIGIDNLVENFFANPTCPMISLKCMPYYLDSNVMLMGDAAHAVVPFYGQGLNTGMEDCLIYDEYMLECNNDLHLSAQQYSATRWKDGHGIADLSMYNYHELSYHVVSKTFLIQKYIESLLHILFPQTIIPLYTMVVFTRMPIQEVVVRNEWQNKMICRGVRFVLFLGTLTIGYSIFKFTRFFF